MNLQKIMERKNNPIKIGLAGMGQMGRGIVSQTANTPWVKVAAVYDHNPERVFRLYDSYGLERPVDVDDGDDVRAEELIRKGKSVLLPDVKSICKIPSVEVVVDATGSPEWGAVAAWESIENGKHIVLLTVETDVVVGRILRKKAEEKGVIYTLSAGDEHASAKELYDFAVSLGFEVVAAGKGKNNPLNYHVTPKDLEEEARSKRMSPKMLTSFVDGTKTAVEMTALSNATGLLPDVRGMHGVSGKLEEMVNRFTLKDKGGILSQEGVVDFIFGLAPGVFVIVKTDNQEMQEILTYLKVGEGSRYFLYRPYHLVSLETLNSVYKVVLYHEPTIVPLYTPYSEVITCAKRDLEKGEIIDGIGGFMVYGLIERYEVAKRENLVPIGLLEGAKVLRNIKKDEPLTFDDVLLRDGFIQWLRKKQEESGL